MADIRDLQLLVSLSRHKHFSRAADDCGISQPAFSARIRKMEEGFALPLVRRGNTFLGFTREGEVVLKWARKLLADVEGMRQEIDALNSNLNGKLAVGVIPTALPFAATVSSQLRRLHPNLLDRNPLAFDPPDRNPAERFFARCRHHVLRRRRPRDDRQAL